MKLTVLSLLLTICSLTCIGQVQTKSIYVNENRSYQDLTYIEPSKIINNQNQYGIFFNFKRHNSKFIPIKNYISLLPERIITAYHVQYKNNYFLIKKVILKEFKK